MESGRFLQCLGADAARLRAVAARDLSAPVPSCPGWSVATLVEHVALGYLHKVDNMRQHGPAQWPPDGAGQAPLALLDRAYAALLAELTQRGPAAPSYTWYGPEQTVGFWYRRMAQETVIHRVDAELALGEPVVPIPADLALDGIDEVLVRFLAFACEEEPDEFAAQLAGEPADVLVAAGGSAWRVALRPAGITVSAAAPDEPAAARLSGEPQTVLLWLWRRVDAAAVRFAGDQSALGRLRDVLGTATQ
ncbi:MAG TPA: maleylpyruvate isomerase family mycothiol-dependent enzyme [Pilimelia sp.]|nr:maleylpyruvate isomerase family mycothiol-dependent enzyme [Pilimelia sp.]